MNTMCRRGRRFGLLAQLGNGGEGGRAHWAAPSKPPRPPGAAKPQQRPGTPAGSALPTQASGSRPAMATRPVPKGPPARQETARPTPRAAAEAPSRLSGIAERARGAGHQTRRSYSGAIMAALMFAAGIGVVIAAILGNQPRHPTLGQFKEKLGIAAAADPANFTLSRELFLARAGEPLVENATATIVQVEYRLDIGIVVVDLARKDWEAGKAVIKQISTR